jgi:hypothetical protein
MLDREIYEGSRLIAIEKGDVVDLLKLDPMITSARRYTDEVVDILLVKQVAYDDEGSVFDVERSVIRLINSTNSWDHEGLDLEVSPIEGGGFETNVIFDYIFMIDDMEGGVFVLMPGTWIEHLDMLRKQITDGWMVPRRHE